jgi:hypothetical protein
VYETFPEGVALIRNNMVLYANKSFYHLLDIKGNYPNHTNSLTSIGGAVDNEMEYDNLK